MGFGCVWYFREAFRTRKELGSLNLGVLLLATDASNAPLYGAAYTPPSSVTPDDADSFRIGSNGWDDTGGFGMVYASGAMVRGHLNARVADALVVLECLLDREGWLSLAFEIIRMVFLYTVRNITADIKLLNVPHQAIVDSHRQAPAAGRHPLHN